MVLTHSMFQPHLYQSMDNHLLSSALPNLFQYRLKLSIPPQISLLIQDNFIELHPLTSEDH